MEFRMVSWKKNEEKLNEFKIILKQIIIIEDGKIYELENY